MLIGPANCAGRALALHEMRTVLAALVRRFDVVFAPGFEAKDWINQLKDHFLMIRGQLPVLVRDRV
jgi:cytochrome P450